MRIIRPVLELANEWGRSDGGGGGWWVEGKSGEEVEVAVASSFFSLESQDR